METQVKKNPANLALDTKKFIGKTPAPLAYPTQNSTHPSVRASTGWKLSTPQSATHHNHIYLCVMAKNMLFHPLVCPKSRNSKVALQDCQNNGPSGSSGSCFRRCHIFPLSPAPSHRYGKIKLLRSRNSGWVNLSMVTRDLSSWTELSRWQG